MPVELKKEVEKSATTPLFVEGILFTRSQTQALEDRLGRIVVETMHGIKTDTDFRVKNALIKASLLNQGVFSSYRYLKALQVLRGQVSEHAQRLIDARITKLKEGAFFHGCLSSEFFVHRRDEKREWMTGNIPYSFELREGKSASKAFLSVIGPDKKLSLLGGLAVVQLCYAKAVFDVLGPEKFDGLFAAGREYAFAIEGRSEVPLFLVPLIGECPANSLKPGDWVSIPGANWYSQKHWHGRFGVLNVVTQNGDFKDVRYAGFELPIQGASHKEILQIFTDAFNRKPILFEMINEKHKRLLKADVPSNTMRKLMKPCTIELTDLEKQPDRKLEKYWRIRLHAERIDQLASVSIEKGHQLMKKWLAEFDELNRT